MTPVVAHAVVKLIPCMSRGLDLLIRVSIGVRGRG